MGEDEQLGRQLGARIEEALAGRSIAWLSQALDDRGVPSSAYSSVYRYAKGVQIPSLRWLREAAKSLGVRFEYLASGTLPMKEPRDPGHDTFLWWFGAEQESLARLKDELSETPIIGYDAGNRSEDWDEFVHHVSRLPIEVMYPKGLPSESVLTDYRLALVSALMILARDRQRRTDIDTPSAASLSIVNANLREVEREVEYDREGGDRATTPKDEEEADG